MQIVITIEPEMNVEDMISLANVMSSEIDRIASDPTYTQYPYYANRLSAYQRKFDSLCQFIDAKGVSVPNLVRCPES